MAYKILLILLSSKIDLIPDIWDVHVCSIVLDREGAKSQQLLIKFILFSV